MDPDEDLSDAIDVAVQSPKKVVEGETSVEQHSLADLIAADRYVRAKRAREGGSLGITYGRFVPPGTQDA